jgi:hypothetical protein
VPYVLQEVRRTQRASGLKGLLAALDDSATWLIRHRDNRGEGRSRHATHLRPLFKWKRYCRVRGRSSPRPAQLDVLGFGLLVDRNIGVCVLPQSEEVLIRLARCGFFAHQSLRPGQLHV